MITINEQRNLIEILVKSNNKFSGNEDLLEDCVFAIRKGLDIGYHHITNGTIKTIASIVGCSMYEVLDRTFEWSVFNAKIDELLNFINRSI